MNIASVAAGNRTARKRIAIIGSGISGASAAWALNELHDVTVFEAAARPGGHTATVDIDYDGLPISVDTGFIVYNELNYPDLTALFAHLGVETHESNMGFSLSLDSGRLEWSGQNIATVFAQPRNLVSPPFLRMLREILRFNRESVLDRDAGNLATLSIGDYLARRGYSPAFRDNYLIPMAAAIWSTPRAETLAYPAAGLVTFFENHRLLHTDRPAWRTVTGGSRCYLERLLAPLGERVRLASPVRAVTRDAFGVSIALEGSEAERFDEVVIACHSDQALAMLSDASDIERRLLGAIPYRANRVVLHRDERLMPRRRRVWTSWNYMRSSRDADEPEVSVSYWMNCLQGIDPKCPLFVSLNPTTEPREELVFGEWSFEHPQYDARGFAAQARLDDIQNVNRTLFAGAWTGYGFHEDGLRSGLNAAIALGAEIPWRETMTGEPAAAIAAE